MLKRSFDVLCALLLLLPALPLLLGLALMIVLTSGRPVLFLQQRAGRHGRPFRVIKLRTVRTGPHDPLHPERHLLPGGAFLRRFALDELPQLWNVLRGQMSLVGPRPIYPSEVAGYDAEQRRRLDVRPGLTGWAQIHGRNALAWHERVALDVWYVRHRSFRLDLRILLRTPRALLRGAVYGPGNADPGLTAGTPPTPRALRRAG